MKPLHFVAFEDDHVAVIGSHRFPEPAIFEIASEQFDPLRRRITGH